MRIVIKTVSVFLTLFFMGVEGWTQEEPTPYCLNMNEATASRVHDVPTRKITLLYRDSYGQWPELPVTIYDWKRKKLKTIKLSKTFGVNDFLIDLNEISADWELNKVYTWEILNESNQKTIVLLRLIPEPDRTGPEVNLIVNPVQFKCDEFSPKLMEFYADIKGGRAPYTTQWYVLNDAKNDFLYQPLEEKILDAGRTMVVRVDKTPDYYVILHVTDACGKFDRKMVRVVCEDQKKKINTLFIEPLDKALINKVNERSK